MLVTVTYGPKNNEDMTRTIAELDDALTSIELLLAGTHVLEFLPVLAHVPTWFPGTASLRRLAHYRELLVAIRERPWTQVKSAIVSLICASSYQGLDADSTTR